MADDPVIQVRECKLCGHRWYPRTPERPFQCPKCKSARWEVGRARPPRAVAC
jgi:predicted Zn-ribbon and HTH transcriptional regulator